MKSRGIESPLAISILALCFTLQETSGFFLPPSVRLQPDVSSCTRKTLKSFPCRALRAHDILVTMPGGGEKRTVSADEGQTILDALEADGIDAPHSCRSGLCTECAAMVTANLDNVKLEAAVLEPEVSARGFILTCSTTIEGGGVELELGVGENMYDAQYGSFRKDHEDAQKSKPGKWNIPFPDISGA